MKKQYEAPKVKKVEFDYTENATASGVLTQTATRCSSTCSQQPVNPNPNPNPGPFKPYQPRRYPGGFLGCWF